MTEEGRNGFTDAQAAALRVPFEGVQKVKKEWTDKKTGQAKSITLDYIGHAVVTDRLLTVDPAYTFGPLLDETGKPVVVHEGLSQGDTIGVWGRLGLLGSEVVEFCSGRDLMDAYSRCLCRAAMRRGVALDLWIKDDEFKAPQPSPETARSHEPVRQEGVQPYPIPTSWPKVKDAFRDCDNPEESEALYVAFLEAAVHHQFGKLSLKNISSDERKVMLQKAAGAVCWMHDSDMGVDGPFTFFLEKQHRSAWARVLDGAELQIPNYVAPEPATSAEAEAESYDEEAARLAAETFAETGQDDA